MDIKPPKQADLESRKEQQEIINREKTVLILSTGRKVKVGWMEPPTNDKIDDIVIEHDDISKLVESGDINQALANKRTRQYFAKITAAILLNEKLKIKFFWWLKWRIIYNFWGLTGQDHLRILQEAKKKGQGHWYYVAMALSMTIVDTWTMMTKKEAEVFLRELKLASEQQR